MTRTSPDFWKLKDGSIIPLWQDKRPPKGAILWSGFDYIRQVWLRKGKLILRLKKYPYYKEEKFVL